MIWLSAVLVFGAMGWFLSVVGPVSSELAFGYEQAIHARIPWLVLGVLWVGGGLGLVALFRSRRWYSWIIVGLEAIPVVLLSVYFLQISYLPESTLRVAVGDAFPSYSLPDQDQVFHTFDRSEPGSPALYIFYRGDW